MCEAAGFGGAIYIVDAALFLGHLGILQAAHSFRWHFSLGRFQLSGRSAHCSLPTPNAFPDRLPGRACTPERGDSGAIYERKGPPQLLPLGLG